VQYNRTRSAHGTVVRATLATSCNAGSSLGSCIMYLHNCFRPGSLNKYSQRVELRSFDTSWLTAACMFVMPRSTVSECLSVPGHVHPCGSSAQHTDTKILVGTHATNQLNVVSLPTPPGANYIGPLQWFLDFYRQVSQLLRQHASCCHASQCASMCAESSIFAALQAGQWLPEC
jgi:hypothetical protein